MAGHAQLKFVMTECSKTQIRMTGLISYSETSNRMEVVAQKEKEVRLLFPKAFGELLGVNPAMVEKAYWD